jgi:HEAT repeat protein
MTIARGSRLAFGLLAGIVLVGCGNSRRIDYSVPTLVNSLKDPDPNMRYYAAQSLGGFGAQAVPAVPDLTDALKDDVPMVRMGAAYALAEIGAPAAAARNVLEQTTKDSDAKVRDAAAYALKRLQGQPR